MQRYCPGLLTDPQSAEEDGKKQRVEDAYQVCQRGIPAVDDLCPVSVDILV